MFGRPGEATNLGPQVRGFGILHDGSVDTVRRFLGASVFTLTNQQQNQLERFVLVMDSNFAPIVGQQVTLNATNAVVVAPRLDLMIQRAGVGECDLVVKGTIAGLARGAVRLGDGVFQLDRSAETIDDASLRSLAATTGQELTYTCVPPGSGTRIGVDRDDDGFLDRDELDQGRNPADATSIPSPPTPIRASSLTLRDDDKAPITLEKRRLSLRSAKYKGAASGVIVPAFDGDGDPTLHGARLDVYDGDGGGSAVTLTLPASGWTRTGSVTNPGYKYADKKHVVGPITTVTLRNGTLGLKGGGAALYPLTGAPQGVVAVRLDLGTAVRLCTAAPAKEPMAKNDTTAQFIGARNTPAPATCNDLPN
jgi:hypothetical protein